MDELVRLGTGLEKGTYKCLAHSNPRPVFAPVTIYVFPERSTFGRKGFPDT